MNELHNDTQAIAARLKQFVRAMAPGHCRAVSLGADCPCPLCDIDRWSAHVETLTQQVAELRAEIDAAWFGIDNGFDIESRAELEQQSKTNGFKYGLAQAVHHMWKRNPKVQQAEQQRDAAHAALAKYGQHEKSCPLRYRAAWHALRIDCTCGLDAALAASAPQKGDAR